MEQTPERVRVEAAPLRCPFCHEDVAPEASDWVACGACLARHHAACWGEGGACAACQGTTRLLREDVDLGPVEPVAAPAPARAARRDEVLRMLDAEDRRQGAGLDWVLGPLTLFLYSILSAESRLAHHARTTALPRTVAGSDALADVAERAERYRRDATEGTVRGCGARQLAASVAFLLAGVGAGTAGVMLPMPNWAEAAPRLVAALAGGGWLLYVLVALRLHWYAAQRHEAAQLGYGLLARDATPDAARWTLGEHRAAWGASARSVGLTLLGLFVPYSLVVLLPYAFRRALAFHEEREDEVEALKSPRPPGKGAT